VSHSIDPLVFGAFPRMVEHLIFVSEIRREVGGMKSEDINQGEESLKSISLNKKNCFI